MDKPFKYVIRCKKCTKLMSIVEIYFTRGTTILFWVVCAVCGIDEERKCDFFDIQADIRRTEEITLLSGNMTVH